MERYHPSTRLEQPTLYRVTILGTLDKHWADYYGGMTIEHVKDPKRGATSILTGCLADQAALMGVLNSLYDLGCPILSVEYRETE